MANATRRRTPSPDVEALAAWSVLADLGDATPLMLWRSGTVPSALRVAVLGSRAATSYGVEVPRSIGVGLAGRGVVCDTARVLELVGGQG